MIGPLKEDKWSFWLHGHPDRCVSTLLLIVTRGVRVGYRGPYQTISSKPHQPPLRLLRPLMRIYRNNSPITGWRSFLTSPQGCIFHPLWDSSQNGTAVSGIFITFPTLEAAQSMTLFLRHLEHSNTSPLMLLFTKLDQNIDGGHSSVAFFVA